MRMALAAARRGGEWCRGRRTLRAPALVALALLSSRVPSSAQQAQAPNRPAPVLGAPASFDVLADERVLVASGTALRREPAERAPVLVVVDAAAELEVVGRQGDWVRVRYDGWRGWIPADGDAASSAGLFERPLATPTAERVARARAQLTGTIREYRVAGYGVLSDLEPGPLLALVDGALRHADAAYVEWYGLDPGPPIGEIIVVFAQQESYRRFRAGEAGLEGLDPAGHAGGGLAAFCAQDREAQELGGILMHEVVHLLNQRALAYDLPVWLEEGLASALAWAQRDGDGRTIAGTFWESSTVQEEVEVHGRTRVTRTEIQRRGPPVDLERLLERRRDPALPSLRDLFSMSSEGFLEPGRIDVDYALSAAVVRFLLEGEHGRWREGFVRFLADGARQDRAGADELSSHLGASIEEVEAQFWHWLARL